MTKGSQVGIGMIQGLRENGLVEKLFRIGMDEESTALADHHTIRVRIGLDGGDGLRQPAEGDVRGDGADIRSVRVLDGLGVGGDDFLRVVNLRIDIDEGLAPDGLIQQLGRLVPVHIEVLVVVVSFLARIEDAVVIVAIGREEASAALVLEIIGLEGDGTAVQFGIVLEDTPGIDEHRVGRVEVACNQPVGVVGRRLDELDDGADAQDGVVELFAGAADGFLAHGAERLGEHEAQGDVEDDGRKEDDPQAELAGERLADILDGILHRPSPPSVAGMSPRSRASGTRPSGRSPA